MSTPYYRNDDYETKLERILKAFKADEIDINEALTHIKDVNDVYENDDDEDIESLRDEIDELRSALDEINSISSRY